MTDTRQSIIRTTNENLVLLMNMEKVAGHRSYTGVGGMDQKKLRPGSSEEMPPRLLWKLFLRNADILAQHGGE